MTRISAGVPGAVVQNSNEVYVDSEGRRVRGMHVTLPAENVEELRQGYRCIGWPGEYCLAAQPSAFPEECVEPYCRFPIRERQAEAFAREFGGEEDLWPNHTWEREEAEAQAELEAHRRRKEGVKVWTPTGDVTLDADPAPEPVGPVYPEMTFEDFQAEPLPRGRWKRRFGS